MQLPGPTRVALVEDNRGDRDVLATVINATPGLVCQDAYSSAEQALAHLPISRPDILLLDLHLPRRSGLDILPELKRQFPALIVIVLTIEERPEVIFRALAAGADGYLVKPVEPIDLVAALEEALDGGAPMSAPIARLVIRSFRDRPAQASSAPDLSSLEREILRLLAAGFQRKEIAQELDLGLRTVAKHIHDIYDKLHAQSAPQAIAEYLATAAGNGLCAGFQHALLRTRLQTALETFNHAHRLGAVLGPGLGCRLPHGIGSGPDVSFVPMARLRQLGFHPDTTTIFPGAPDLAIEILGPSNPHSNVQARLQDLFAAGTQRAWLVDPAAKKVLVHRSPYEHRTVGPDGVLDGEHLLPGFRLPLDTLFAPWDSD